MQQHVMIDIETLGLRINSDILAIGICKFDQTGAFHAKKEFFLNLQDSAIDSDTLQWHLKANSSFILSWANSSKTELTNVLLYELEKIIAKDTIVWCKSTDFDIAMLRYWLDKYGIKYPWYYRNIRDYRTIANLFPEHKMEEHYPAHSALNDCLNQARHLIKLNEISPITIL